MILLYLACLFPLAVYLLILALLNRGPQPTLVSGVWDFAGVLLALAGFLIFGGPAVLSGLYEQARLAAILDPARLTLTASLLRPLGQLPWSFWFALWFLYFLGVALVSGLLLWRRQNSLAVYNVRTSDFAKVLRQILDDLGLEHRQQGARFSLSQHPSGTASAALEVSAWPALRHITLHWQGESPLRKPVEAALSRALAQVDSGPNPLTGWLIGLAGGFFVALFCGLIAYVFQLLRMLSR